MFKLGKGDRKLGVGSVKSANEGSMKPVDGFIKLVEVSENMATESAKLVKKGFKWILLHISMNLSSQKHINRVLSR